MRNAREAYSAMRLPSRLIRSSVVSLCFALSSIAGTIELEATGAVTQSGFASVPVGTTLIAYLFYDPTAVPISTVQSGYASESLFVAPSSFVVLMGGSTLTSYIPYIDDDFGRPMNENFCCILDNYDGIEWNSAAASVTGPLASDPNYTSGLPGLLNNLYFVFEAPHANGVLTTSTTLPSTFPSVPGQWTNAAFFCECASTISATISSVTVVSPEPRASTLSLLALTAGLLGYRRMRRRDL